MVTVTQRPTTGDILIGVLPILSKYLSQVLNNTFYKIVDSFIRDLGVMNCGFVLLNNSVSWFYIYPLHLFSSNPTSAFRLQFAFTILNFLNIWTWCCGPFITIYSKCIRLSWAQVQTSSSLPVSQPRPYVQTTQTMSARFDLSILLKQQEKTIAKTEWYFINSD